MPFDLRQLMDLIPLAVGAFKPGSPEAAAMMQGYARSKQKIQDEQQQQQVLTRQDQLAQAQIQNLIADNQRADQAQQNQQAQLALNRLTAYRHENQGMLDAIAQKPETVVPPQTDPLQAQNALTVERLNAQQAYGVPAGTPQGPLPNMTQAVQKSKAKLAQSLYAQAEKVYGPEAMASDSITLQTGPDKLGDMKPSQLRAMFEPTAVTRAGQPAVPFTEKRTPPTPGSFEDYLTTSPDRQAQIVSARKTYTEAGRDQQVNPAGDVAIDDQAQQLVDGNIVPSMMSKRSASFNEVLTRANAKSKAQTGQPINLLKLETQYRAAQQFARSQNSSQATRFRSLAGSVVNTINEVRNLSDELKQGGVQLFNRARRGSILQVYGNTPQSDVAARYVAAVNTLKEEFAGLIQGGYAPTESAFNLANQQINGDYGVKDLNAAVTEVQRLINYRLNAFEELGPLLPGQHDPSVASPASGLPPGVTVTKVP